MRFYQYGRGMQVWLTVFWILILTIWTDICFGASRPRYGMLLLWSVTAGLNLCSIWLNYWTIEDGGFAQHGLFYRRWFSGNSLRYAGPPRGKRLRRLLRKSIEIETGRATGPLAPRYVNVADRASFLAALQQIAPAAEIVSGPAR